MSESYTYIHMTGLTDVGQVRDHNEDSIGLSPQRGWCCVADGMGGEQAGDVASKITVDLLEECIAELPDEAGVDNLASKRQLMEQALLKANARIRRYVREKELSQSGSTVAALAFDFAQPGKALMAHAGDSRIYRMRGKAFNQLTIDHSVAAAAGVEDENEIPLLFRGVVTKAVGIKKVLEIDFETIEIEADDLYLICSDGLSGFVNDAQLAETLYNADRNALETVAASLIQAANDAGGKDNISAVLIHVSGLPETSAEPVSLTQKSLPEDEELQSIRQSVAEYQEAQQHASASASNSTDLFSSSGSSDMLDSFTESTNSLLSESEDPLSDSGPALQAITSEPSTKEAAVPETDSAAERGMTTLRTPPSTAQKGIKQTTLLVLVALLLAAGISLVLKDLLSSDDSDATPPPGDPSEKQSATGSPTATAVSNAPAGEPAVTPGAIPAPKPAPVVEGAADAPETIRAAQVERLNGLLQAAREHGNWGALSAFMEDTGLKLSEAGENAGRIALAKKWIEIWTALKDQPSEAHLVYTHLNVHARSLDEVGVSWEAHPLPENGLAADPEKRANQVCRAIHLLGDRGPGIVDTLGQQLRASLHLFSIDQEPVLSYLATFYNPPEPLGDLAGIKAAVREVQMANKALSDFKQILQQSPSGYLSPSATPDFSTPQFTRASRTLLENIEEATGRTQFQKAVTLFDAQIKSNALSAEQRSQGAIHLKAVYESYDALSLYRINHPTKAGDETTWISLGEAKVYRAHFTAIRDFLRWNRSLSQAPGGN